MISAPSRPPSPSLHLIISPNIITYSEALKRQTIPWHSNIHQEPASSLKNLIKHAQHKHTHTETHTHDIHTLANSASWEALPRGANKVPLALIYSVLSGVRDLDVVRPLWKAFVWTYRMKKGFQLQGSEIYCTFGKECAVHNLWATCAALVCHKQSCWPENFYIMSSTVTYPDNFPFWHPAFKLPAPGCHVGCMFLMKITCQEGMPFNSLSVE